MTKKDKVVIGSWIAGWVVMAVAATGVFGVDYSVGIGVVGVGSLFTAVIGASSQIGDQQ